MSLGPMTDPILKGAQMQTTDISIGEMRQLVAARAEDNSQPWESDDFEIPVVDLFDGDWFAEPSVAPPELTETEAELALLIMQMRERIQPDHPEDGSVMDLIQQACAEPADALQQRVLALLAPPQEDWGSGFEQSVDVTAMAAMERLDGPTSACPARDSAIAAEMSRVLPPDA